MTGIGRNGTFNAENYFENAFICCSCINLSYSSYHYYYAHVGQVDTSVRISAMITGITGFEPRLGHFHINCPGVRCSLRLFHDAPAKSDEVYSLNSPYYPECGQRCTDYCKQHRHAKCLRLLNHNGRHTCSLDCTPSVSTGASNVPTRTQRCLTRCPLCSTQCSLDFHHIGYHKCKHGRVVQEKAIYHVTIGAFYNSSTAIDTIGKTCSTMCTGTSQDHQHVYQTCKRKRGVCVDNGGAATQGVSHVWAIAKDVCSHQDFWRLHSFALP